MKKRVRPDYSTIDWESLALHLSIPEIIDEIEARYGFRPVKMTVWNKLAKMGLDPRGRWSRPRKKRRRHLDQPHQSQPSVAQPSKAEQKKLADRKKRLKYYHSEKGKKTRAAYKARTKDRKREVEQAYRKRHPEKLRAVWRRYARRHAEEKAARQRERYAKLTAEEKKRLVEKARRNYARRRAAKLLAELTPRRKDSPCPASNLQRNRRVVSL